MDLPSETDPREYLAMKHDQTSWKDLFALFSALAPERMLPISDSMRLVKALLMSPLTMLSADHRLVPVATTAPGGRSFLC